MRAKFTRIDYAIECAACTRFLRLAEENQQEEFTLRLFRIGVEMMAAAVLLVPILLLIKKFSSKLKNNIFGYIIFALYLSAMCAAVGLPSITYLKFDLNVNFIPFLDMATDWKNSILNFILFIPLGVALPLFCNKFTTIKRVICLGFTTSLAIEILQIFTFRATDVNDLITNTFGALLGGLIAKWVIRRRPICTADNSARDLYIVFGAVFVVMFFLQPFVSSLIWRMIG